MGEEPQRRKRIFPLLNRPSIVGSILDRFEEHPRIGKHIKDTRESVTKSLAQLPGNIISTEIYSGIRKKTG